jgi:hypothetical protein
LQLSTAFAWRPARLALAGVLVFHLAAITMANVSRTTALGTTFHRPFETYIDAARLWQSWDMFTTIPHFHDMAGALVAFDDQGNITRYGPMLPDLRPLRKDPRIIGAFLRLAFVEDGYAAYNVRYLRAVCDAIATRSGKRPAKVGFELYTEELRSIQDVQRDNRIGERKTYPFGPIACPR